MLADFLAPFWRDSGRHCLVSITNGKIRHFWSDEYDDFAPILDRYKEPGRDLYWAMSSYSRSERRQDAVQSVPAFWLDLDVGEKKDYQTLDAAREALDRFVSDAGLPAPTHLVGSGYGLHVYWRLDASLTGAAWLNIARNLQMACQSLGLKADSHRTADSASILRVPGTLNWKNKDDPRAVVLLHHSTDPIAAGAFAGRLLPYTAPKLPTRSGSAMVKAAEDEFTMVVSRPPVSAHDLAQRCGQIARVRDLKGAVCEPLWYHALSVLRLTTEAPAICHEWSCGHPQYSASQTDQKIAQLEVKEIGAVSCDNFMRDSDMPDLCTLCPSRGKVRTPYSLGRVIDTAATKEKGMPGPFALDKEGRIVYHEGPDAPEELLFPYPLRLIARLDDGDDHSLLIEVDLPQDGTQEVEIPLSAFYSRNTLFERLAARGILIAPKYMDLIRLFFILRVQQMQENDGLRTVAHHMGWQEDGAFLLGRDRFYIGETRVGAASGTARQLSQAFRPKGGFDKWLSVLRHYETAPPAWAFAFLAGLGAPFMHFLGLHGVTVSMTGTTGTGKSTLQRAVMSAYGDPNLLIAQRTDTPLSVMHRLGQYHSLPVCIDEMTNASPDELSDLVYQVTQGQERARLTIAGHKVVAGERGGWDTTVLLSTNHSLLTKLAMAKPDCRAEAVRVWEMHMTKYGDQDDMTKVNQIIRKTFGAFSRQFVPVVQKTGQTLMQAVAQRVGAWEWRQDERYWQGAASIVLATAVTLKAMGAAAFDQKALRDYIVSHRTALRGHLERLQRVGIDQVLGAFLQGHAGDVLVASKDVTEGLGLPRSGRVVARYEAFRDLLFIDRRIFMQFLSEHEFGSWQEIFESWRLRGFHPRVESYNIFKGAPLPNTPIECLVVQVPKDNLYAVGGVGVLDKDTSEEAFS